MAYLLPSNIWSPTMLRKQRSLCLFLRGLIQLDIMQNFMTWKVILSLNILSTEVLKSFSLKSIPKDIQLIAFTISMTTILELWGPDSSLLNFFSLTMFLSNISKAPNLSILQSDWVFTVSPRKSLFLSHSESIIA